MTAAATRIIAVGRLGSGPEAELFARYTSRLRPRPVLVELAEGRGTPAEIKRREATALLSAVPPDSSIVALDQGGAAVDTLGLCQLIAAFAQPPCFLIGGAEGLDATVLARAKTTLSLGPMTWPHLVARVLLAEQLYRAQCIATGHPYHRAGRP